MFIFAWLATGYISLFMKMLAFSQTADQDFIFAFQDELDNNPDFYITETDQRFFRTILWELNNNLDEFLNLQEDTPLLQNPGDVLDGFYLQNYVATNRRLLLVQQGAGRTDMAHEMARRIIAVDKLINDRSEAYDAYDLSGFMALAALDTDKAVELILALKPQHPTWSGTGAGVQAIPGSYRRIDSVLNPDITYSCGTYKIRGAGL